jgi:hypothetical protein
MDALRSPVIGGSAATTGTIPGSAVRQPTSGSVRVFGPASFRGPANSSVDVSVPRVDASSLGIGAGRTLRSARGVAAPVPGVSRPRRRRPDCGSAAGVPPSERSRVGRETLSLGSAPTCRDPSGRPGNGSHTRIRSRGASSAARYRSFGPLDPGGPPARGLAPPPSGSPRRATWTRKSLN